MRPLVSAEDLAVVLAGGLAVRLLDARPSADAYAKGHLRGAVHASLDRDLSGAQLAGHDPARGGRHPLPRPEAFAEKLASWGIGAETPVVVYDDQGGANAAARAYWMIRALGHEDVRVLDGGLSAALAAGMELTTSPASSPAAGEVARAADWQRPTVSIDDVGARVSDPGWKVLDVRSAERFRGDAEPFDPVAGHIPGAENRFFGENLTPTGTFKPAGELRAMYTRLLGDVPASRLIVHCGSGVTACHTLLALDVAGLPGASLYVGSWSEWCRTGRPQAKG